MLLPRPHRMVSLAGVHQFQGAVRIELDPALPGEGYRLHVRPDGVSLWGGGEAGVFHGRQTLRQLLPPSNYRTAGFTGPWTIPCVEVEDAPRFGWRGCMLDVARHFMPKANVLRFIDLLAVHKLNVLHLHLTDDQGWRIEIKRYPRLTSVGAWRRESMVGSRHHERFDGRPHGGFYTQDDIREIVAYAAARHITVVPEIDLPGHTQAAIAAYPHLGSEEVEVWTRWGVSPHGLNGSPESIAFFRDVFDEVLELFPSRYICFGGDESTQNQTYAHSMRSYLEVRGRKPFAWDEVLEAGLEPGLTIAAWRGPDKTTAALSAGHEVVACPDMSCYLDYRQSEHPGEPIPVGTLLTLEDVWRFDPPDGVLGAQANVWTEYMDSPRGVDYAVFPRLCAFAEVVWSGRSSDYPDFERRLAQHLPRLDALGVEYRPLDGPLPWQTRPDAPGWPR